MTYCPHCGEAWDPRHDEFEGCPWADDYDYGEDEARQ